MENITVNLSHDEHLNISILEISNAIQHLESIDSTELNIVLINLLKESLREITGFQKQRSELTQTSIQVRNIFELYLITKHVFTGNKGLKSWLGQLHKDLDEINQGFVALLKKNNMPTSEIDELVEFCNKSLGDSPYQSKGCFNLKTLAINYGYEEHYNFLYKLSSKLIHPTSIKINCYSALAESNNYIAVLTYCGIRFSRELENLAIQVKNKLHA